MTKIFTLLAKSAVAIGLTLSSCPSMDPPQPILTAHQKIHPDSVCTIAANLTFDDLCSMETTCKAFASPIRNAPQYQAIIHGFDYFGYRGGEKLEIDNTYKKNSSF
jgi:hypothetical protein